MPGVRNSSSLRGSTWLLAALAALALEVVRTPDLRQPWLGWLATLFTLALAAAAGFWFHRQRPDSRRVSLGALLLVVGFVSAPFLAEGGFRATGSDGMSPEIVQLVALRNFMFALAAVALWPGVLQLTCVLSLFLTLGALMLMNNWLSYGVVLLYGLVGIWWLMGASWERMHGRFASETRREIPLAVGGGAAGIAILATGATALFLGGASSTVVLGGYFWGSGGNRWYDLAASRGVGDGDALVAAEQHAASFGAVESELFLDSEMPSFYDVFNDTYGEPIVKRSQDKTVGLSSQNTQESTPQTVQTKEAGREFSTVRRRTPRRDEPLADRDSMALLFVAGRSPLHLRLETFDHFDGRVWSHTAEPGLPDERRVVPQMATLNNEPWLELHRIGNHAPQAQEETHTLRLMNLVTQRIPTPGHPTGVHIDKVNRRDFYAWTADDVLEMPGRDRIPPLSVIHVRSRNFSAEEMSAIPLPVISASGGPDSAYVQSPELPGRGKIDELARQWTAGVPRGWPQVEAIVARLRGGEFVVDREATLQAECVDAAGCFLLESRRGPDYLFATSAALLMRSLGYPARVATGLYANPARYDRTSRQTKVIAEDAHFWVEAAVDGTTWITVEPTPGYEVLEPRRTFAQTLSAAVRSGWKWVMSHPVFSALGLVIVIVLTILRRQLGDAWYTLLWLVSQTGTPPQRLLATVRLLERRARLAGCGRPAHVTLRRWYLPLARSVAPPEEQAIERLLTATGAILYAPAVPFSLVAADCRRIATHFTLRRFRAAAKARLTHSPRRKFAR